MDTKNVIAAISLSAAVIILYGLFFAPSPKEMKNLDQEKTTLTSEAPKIDTSEKEKVNSLISKLEAAIQADDNSSMQS